MRNFILKIGLLVIIACLQTVTAAASDNNKPTRVLSRGTTFAAGYSHSCVSLADGRVQCWGGNQNGQLGSGLLIDFSEDPVDVRGITNALAVSGGGDHTCALLADGTVKCWGQNQFGQLGNGTMNNKFDIPVTVIGLTNATAVAAGWQHACALLADGRVTCWGLMKSDEKHNQIAVVVPVTGITNALGISGGERHTCAVLADGTVKCWGKNGNGQLGNGTQTDSWDPVSVSGISNAVAVASGYDHSCAVLADGTVKCWGTKMTGEDTAVVSLVPETVSGITSAVAVAGGYYHSCALVRDGRVKCWGANSGGQLGNGTSSASPVSVFVKTLIGAVAVAAGGCQYSCAVLADGTVQCWGHVHFRTLRGGTMKESLVPLPVRGIAGPVAVAREKVTGLF